MNGDDYNCATVGCEGFADEVHAFCADCSRRKKRGRRERGPCRELGCTSSGPDYLCDEHGRVRAMREILAKRPLAVTLGAPAPIVIGLSRKAAAAIAALARECIPEYGSDVVIELHVRPDSIELRAPMHDSFRGKIRAERMDIADLLLGEPYVPAEEVDHAAAA